MPKNTMTVKYYVTCRELVFIEGPFDYREAKEKKVMFKKMYPGIKGEWRIDMYESVNMG